MTMRIKPRDSRWVHRQEPDRRAIGIFLAWGAGMFALAALHAHRLVFRANGHGARDGRFVWNCAPPRSPAIC